MSKYTYDICTKEDIDDINRIMEEIDHEINTESIFVMDDKDFIADHIEKKGFTIKTLFKDRIIGFLIVRFPREEADNLGKEMNLPKQALHQVAHIESVAVVPKHRGKRLQHKMIQYAEKIIKQRGLQYSMATVSPRNKYSLINFLKHDYEVIKVKKKYSGVKRLILLKNHTKKEA